MREPSTLRCSDAVLQFLELFQRTNKILLGAKDSNQVLHDFLQITMNRIGILPTLTLERSQHLPCGLFDLAGINGRSLNRLRMLGGRQTCATAEDEQV